MHNERRLRWKVSIRMSGLKNSEKIKEEFSKLWWTNWYGYSLTYLFTKKIISPKVDIGTFWFLVK